MIQVSISSEHLDCVFVQGSLRQEGLHTFVEPCDFHNHVIVKRIAELANKNGICCFAQN